MHGTADDVVSYASGRAAYDPVPWPKALLTLPGQGHGDALLRTGDPAFEVVADVTTNFLRWSLYGDRGARARLAKDARSGIGALDDHLRRALAGVVQHHLAEDVAGV